MSRSDRKNWSRTACVCTCTHSRACTQAVLVSARRLRPRTLAASPSDTTPIPVPRGCIAHVARPLARSNGALAARRHNAGLCKVRHMRASLLASLRSPHNPSLCQRAASACGTASVPFHGAGCAVHAGGAHIHVRALRPGPRVARGCGACLRQVQCHAPAISACASRSASHTAPLQRCALPPVLACRCALPASLRGVRLVARESCSALRPGYRPRAGWQE